MVRRSKPERDRSVSYKRPRLAGKKLNLPQKPRKMIVNAISGDAALNMFIPKIL